MTQKRSLEAMNGNETTLADASTENVAQNSADLPLVNGGGGGTDPNLSDRSSLKETILDLKWGVRNQIISNLYSHSSFLIQKISDKLKQERMKENFELIQTLMNLSAANYETERPRKRTKLDDDDSRSSEIILDLSWADRDLIVDNLLKNHHCAIMYSSLVGRAVKDNLTKENNSLVSILTNLRVRKIEEEDEAMEEEPEDTASKSEEQIKPKEHADNELDKANNPSSAENDANKTIVTDIAEIKKDMLIVKELGKFLKDKELREKSEIRLSLKVPVNKLENKKLDDKKPPFISSPFFCAGIQWSIKVYVKSKEFIDYLHVFLQPELKCDSCEVAAEFRLISEDKLNIVKKEFNHTFIKPSPAGFHDFIEMSSLLDQKNGFINGNGEIELEVHLKVADKPIIEI